MPSESGVTSSNSMFFTPWSRMLAWTAAPSATTSSGFSSMCGLRPKNSWTVRRISGVRVVPPTRTTSSMSAGLSCASASACLTGPIVRSTTGRIRASSAPRVKSCVNTSPFGNGKRSVADSASERRCFTSMRALRSSCASSPCGGKNLKDIAVGGGNELENGNVESTAAEIVDGNFAALFFVQAVGERRGGGLVDEPQNFEACDLAGVLGGLALGIVEIGWDCDHGAVDGFAKMGFGPIFQFAEDESGNLRRGKNSIAEHNADDIFARRFDAKGKQF